MAEHDADRSESEALILEHLPDIVTLCNRMFRQRSDAEDATQQAVIAVLSALPSFEHKGPVRHWLLKVALNASRQHRRTLSRKTRRETTLTETGTMGAEMPNSVEEREEQESLRAAIAELPDDIRESVTLYYFNGLTQTQIAACMECSQKTVHVRVQKGLARLGERLAGSSALGAMVAAGAAGRPVLDAVPPALLATVKQSIAGHFAATATTVAGSTVATTTTALATGGIVMNTKLIVAGTVLALTCFVGGAMLSDLVFARGDDAEHADRVARLQSEIEEGRREAETTASRHATATRRNAARVADLTRELTALREQVGERDRQIAELQARVPTDAADASARAPSREETWAELQRTMLPVLLLLQKMQEEGADQFALGPQMVAELGRLSEEDYAKMLAFDAEEKDPNVIAEIRAVMLQALIFVPKVATHRDAYMARYIERARSGAFGDSFTAGALRRIAFRMPPFVDAYARIVEPMDDELKREFVDMALQRAGSGVNESERMDGVVFLARTPGAAATEQLTDVFREPANSARLRIAAAKGLGERADEDVLRLLRDAEASDQDDAVRAAAKSAAERVERRLAAER